MATPKVALIEYVGRQRNRGDDVLKTGRVWKAAGDVVEVPEDQKHFYLKHPDEWRETSEEAVEKREAARLKAAKNLGEIRGEWEKLTVEDLEQIRDDLNAEIQRRKVESAKAPVVTAETKAKAASAPALHTGKDEPSKQAAANRLLQVKAAIGSLDHNDPEHYTGEPDKRPRVDAVSEAVGFKVSAEEIKAAQALEDTK